MDNCLQNFILNQLTVQMCVLKVLDQPQYEDHIIVLYLQSWISSSLRMISIFYAFMFLLCSSASAPLWGWSNYFVFVVLDQPSIKLIWSFCIRSFGSAPVREWPCGYELSTAARLRDRWGGSACRPPRLRYPYPWVSGCWAVGAGDGQGRWVNRW